MATLFIAVLATKLGSLGQCVAKRTSFANGEGMSCPDAKCRCTFTDNMKIYGKVCQLACTSARFYRGRSLNAWAPGALAPT